MRRSLVAFMGRVMIIARRHHNYCPFQFATRCRQAFKEKTMLVPCRDKRRCFAKTEMSNCRILSHAYPDGRCPFCKPVATVTRGKTYPINRDYSFIYQGLNKGEK